MYDITFFLNPGQRITGSKVNGLSPRPLIIISLDAADPELLRQWTEEGFLPGLAGILKQGCWGRIGGKEYVTPHGLWLSFFTGSSRAQHSYYYFRQFQPADYTMKVFNPRQANALPFWRLLQSENGKTAIIDALPSQYTGMIRINLRGREYLGIVEPGREYEQLLEQIENDLHELIDPVTDMPAVEQIHRTARLYGTNDSHLLPDLFVKWKPTGHFQEVLYHPRGAIRQKKPQYYRTNNHTEHGFFAATGPSIVECGEMPDASLLDFAPKFLAMPWN